MYKIQLKLDLTSQFYKVAYFNNKEMLNKNI